MKKKVLCDSCGRNMCTKSGASLIGVAITLNGIPGSKIEEIYPEIKPGRSYLICFVCWLKSLGVKFK